MEGQKKKRVLIVGAGAAGMSCAYHLSEHPDKFDVTIIEQNDYCGGQAFSIPIDKEKTGASWLNQGVQGGSHIFHHTMAMFSRQGYWADPVTLQVSFGKGDIFWTNSYPTKMLERHQKEVVRFFKMLKIVRAFEIFFALLPIKYLVKLFRYTEEFANIVALPMVALFLGTGNYTPEVPTMILERLSTSPTYGMWYPPDKHSIASNEPPMFVFPNFTEFYGSWKNNLTKRGVNVRLSTELTHVYSRDKNGVVVRIIDRERKGDGRNGESAQVDGSDQGFRNVVGDDRRDGIAETDENEHNDADKEGQTEHYDELILCTLTDTAKKLLGKSASWRESKVLGSAKFANDITVTHMDYEYMRKHYEPEYNEEQAVTSLGGTDQTARVEAARKKFQPMYMIKMYPQDLTKIEMCFDCTNYQSQFPPNVPFEKHVFQTIFLNKERDGHLWSIDEIDKSKIIRSDWWHQLCHSWTHYLFVVPWMWLLQGRKSTRFCGSWTLVNAHEVACISGIAAAVDLGATYPEDLEQDKFALLAFRLYYLLVYGKWYRRKHNKVGEGNKYAEGLYGSQYQGPGVNREEERRLWKREVEKGRSLEKLE
ncbi:hypothetical protein BDZ85DRAFT_261370 [Elsinoe ampelina]|uniref:FAD/NAD(P)-binding domain-containing protein n=1 Tax=Elsinoe ampelina TaxID=302913 RepID=A0A6A6GD59_9PEZI|nr:hypothetical protein BDZ85DRAFT_261370 [Elsinoe ampelina]